MEEPIDHSFTEPDPEKIGNGNKPVSLQRKKRYRDWLGKRGLPVFWILIILVAFTAGSIGGYQLGISRSPSEMNTNADSAMVQQSNALAAQVNPSKGYPIPAKFGLIGPKLLEAGAFAYGQFEQIYAQSGKPLTDEQKTILTRGIDEDIIINRQNSYFLLNFFWALGLTNKNTILTNGPMMAKGREQVGNFASTGGWTIGAKSPTELYASSTIISFTSEQQDLLDKVSSSVYRPCCDNPTHFPDCNHGMAMLGLLELMASQNANEDQMFQAAKYVNAFWYPQQSLEIAILFQLIQNSDFDDADARQVVSAKYSSGTGFQAVHSYLVSNNLIQQAPGQGGSCGVQ